MICTFSKSSVILASVSLSSSVGFGGILAAVENCEYVWNRLSVYKPSMLATTQRCWLSDEGGRCLLTCDSRVRACCRNWAQPAFAVVAMILLTANEQRGRDVVDACGEKPAIMTKQLATPLLQLSAK